MNTSADVPFAQERIESSEDSQVDEECSTGNMTRDTEISRV